MKDTSTRFRNLFAIFFLAVVIILPTGNPASAAAEQASTKEAADTTPVVIGVPQYAKFSFAAMMKNAFELAREKINKEGGIKGRPIKLVYADDQGKPKAGEKAVRDLVMEQGAVMLVGGYSSSNTVYMAGMAEKLDRPFLISTAADDRITQRKWKNVYRLNPPASGYTQGLEEFFLTTIKPRSIAIVYENSPYGTGGALRMMWFCRESGIEIRKILPYHRERTDPAYIQRILSPLKDEPPDVIYMVSYLKDAIAMVREIRAMKIKSLLVGGAGGFTHPDFITKSGEDANLVLTADTGLSCRRGVLGAIGGCRCVAAGGFPQPARHSGGIGQNRHDHPVRPGQVFLLRKIREAEQPAHPGPSGHRRETGVCLAQGFGFRGLCPSAGMEDVHEQISEDR
jgi:hypothetical protein